MFLHEINLCMCLVGFTCLSGPRFYIPRSLLSPHCLSQTPGCRHEGLGERDFPIVSDMMNTVRKQPWLPRSSAVDGTEQVRDDENSEQNTGADPSGVRGLH